MEDSFTDVLVVVVGLKFFFREDFVGETVLCKKYNIIYKLHMHTLLEESEN